MDAQELNHIIQRTAAQADQDEALAKSLLANAAQKRELLGVIEQLRDENIKLKEEQRTVQITNNIENLNGTYIESITNANLCQPSSLTSTGHTSNTSTL
ncbi:MAG: hypothetical protein IKT19_02665 [Paludibacteraceae bacterium]|nr:hypothetical protein [Paludibacteraceae bacterium]